VQARLDAVDENRVLDTRPALAGGVELGRETLTGNLGGTRPWEGSGGDGRSLGAAAPALVLRENSATLQNRINDLQNDFADETTRRKRAEAQVHTLQGDLQGLRDFYNDYESPIPKTQETRDLDAAENTVYDLHLEAMNTLKDEHTAHVTSMETEFVETLAESDAKFQRLLEQMEAQGFRSGAPGTSSLDTQASPPEVFEQLKEFLKRRMPDETKELVNRGLAGAILPAFYGGGGAVDRAVSIWAGLIAPFMTPADGVVPRKGREVLTAILAAVPSGIALHEAYEHHLDVWRDSHEGKEVIE
jgi:hypothetical protein